MEGRLRTSGIATVTMFALGAPGAAQSPAPACVDAMRAKGVTVERVISVQATPARRGDKIPRPYADSLLTHVAGHFRLPDPHVSLPIYAIVHMPGDTIGKVDAQWAVPSVYILVRVVVARTGRPKRLTLLANSHDLGLDSAFLGALQRGFADSTWWTTPDQRQGDSTTFDVELVMQGPNGRKEREEAAKQERDRKWLERRIGPILLPHYPNGKYPERITGTNVTYPEEEAMLKLGGRAVLHGVIDAEGAWVMSSLWFAEVSHRNFEAAVRAAIPKMRYRPAEAAGCPVAFYGAQPFNFRAPGFFP